MKCTHVRLAIHNSLDTPIYQTESDSQLCKQNEPTSNLVNITLVNTGVGTRNEVTYLQKTG